MKMQELNSKVFELANIILLIVLFITVFGVMLLPISWFQTAYNICYSCIFISSFLCLQRHQRRYFKWIILAALIIQWMYFISNNRVIHGISRFVDIGIFAFTVVVLIIQVVTSKKITSLVIMQSINGYLLMGVFIFFYGRTGNDI